MIISIFESVENIVGKGENAGYQHFLLFQQCFEKKLLFQKGQNVSLCGNGLTSLRRKTLENVVAHIEHFGNLSNQRIMLNLSEKRGF